MALTKDIQGKSFWSLHPEEVARLLETDLKSGILEEEAESRLEVFGLNVIERSSSAPWVVILLNQLKSPLIFILAVAAAVTMFIGHHQDALFILAAVVVNSALGFYQEYKAEKALAELKTYLKQRSRVVRGGSEKEIDASDLVPGDLLRLSQGDRAPADARLVSENDLQADESVLTGESLPVPKAAEAVVLNAGLGDQQSMVFAGTLITQGVATAIVCRTDFSTEIGKIAAMVSDSRSEGTPLQIAIKRFSLWLGGVLGLLTLAVFGIGVALGYSWVDMFLTSVAIAVSAVPEGLPVAMTVILAIGVQRMARRKGVVRKLIAAEALGSTSLIMTDKTGTLTMAQMELSQILPIGRITKDRLLKFALLNTNVLIENREDPPEEWRMSGRVLEVALFRSAVNQGLLPKSLGAAKVLASLPFNAVNKFSASLVRERGRNNLVFLGAPDILLRHSKISASKKKELLKQMDELAASGELVVGVAVKQGKISDKFSFSKDLKVENLDFKGFIALRDPVRPSVKEAIRKVEAAGIRVLIITGDHRGTAEAVAKEVGLHSGPNGVLDAEDLRKLSEEELKEVLPGLRVIARVSPLDKLRIVCAFQELGEVVAMTGDGVNDAPSIKQADVGIAMGSGTEVSRSVADLVLLDDNFETIAAAVEEGRQIMSNIRKVLVYLLSNVASAILLIGGSIAAGLALPLSALQILWVNFFSDSFPAVAFAFERGIDGLGTRPKDPRKELFDSKMKFLIIGIGLATSFMLFALYWFLLRIGFNEDLVRTFIFACFGTYSLFLAFSVRSLDKSIFQYSLLSNRYLVGATAIGVVLMLVAVYAPFLQTLFGTVSLPLAWAAAVALVGVANIAAVEIGKWTFNRGAAIVIGSSSELKEQ